MKAQDFINKNNGFGFLQFGLSNQDIRKNLFNYENPLAYRILNGIEWRIAEGLIKVDPVSGQKRKSYLLYCNRELAGVYFSVSEAKEAVKDKA